MDGVRNDEDGWRTSPHDDKNPEELEAGEDPNVDTSQQEREHADSSVSVITHTHSEQDNGRAPELPLSSLHLPLANDSTVAFTGSDEDVRWSSSPGAEGVNENDEEELIILDIDHPLMKRYRAAQKEFYIRKLEDLDRRLHEKMMEERELNTNRQDLAAKLYNIQQTVARQQAILDSKIEERDRERRRRKGMEEELEEVRKDYNRAVEEDRKRRTLASKLQAEADQLEQQVFYMERLSSELHSDAVTMENTKTKAQMETEQSEQQKLQQDLYVERLTKQVEKLKERNSELDAQLFEQTKIIQTATDTTAEGELETEAMIMENRQILQQWNNTVMETMRRDEAYNTLQEAMWSANHEQQALDAEVKRLRRNIRLEQEKNEELVEQAKYTELNIDAYRKRCEQARAEKAALQDCYNTLTRTIQETEKAKSEVAMQRDVHQSQVNALNKQIGKEECVRMELEEQLLRTMQKKLTHDTTAKHTYNLITQIMAQRREREAELQVAENELAAVELEVTQLGLHCKALSHEQQELQQEVMQQNQQHSAKEKLLSELITAVKHDQATISMLEKKIEQIKANTGKEEDLSPLEIEVASLNKQLEELDVEQKELRQLWLRHQEELVREYQKQQEVSTEVLETDTRLTILQQRSVRKKREIEQESHAVAELEKKLEALRMELNSILSENMEEVDGEEQESSLMEDLRNAERETVETQLQLEELQEEMEEEKNSIVELERQEMFWERKVQLALETHTSVDSETGMEKTQAIEAEIHRLECSHHNQLMQEQERMMTKMEASVSRSDGPPKRSEAQKHKKHNHTANLELQNILQKLQHEFIQKQKDEEECTEVIKQLQQVHSSLSKTVRENQMCNAELQNANSAYINELTEVEEAENRDEVQVTVVTSQLDLLEEVQESDWSDLEDEEEEPELAMITEEEETHMFREVLQNIIQDYPQYKSELYPAIFVMEVAESEEDLTSTIL